MSDALDLAAMRALLRQGRAPAGLSAGLLIVALLLLGLQRESAPVATALLWSSVGAGLFQPYCAIRVGLDVALLELVLAQARMRKRLRASWTTCCMAPDCAGVVVCREAGLPAGRGCAGCWSASSSGPCSSWPHCCWPCAGRRDEEGMRMFASMIARACAGAIRTITGARALWTGCTPSCEHRGTTATTPAMAISCSSGRRCRRPCAGRCGRWRAPSTGSATACAAT